MLRIYLDQLQWVQLAQARTGRPEGQVFLDAYEAVKLAAANGVASFPLSAAHYFETHKQGDQQKRLDLAVTMIEISHLDAIAPPHVIVPYEVEAALIDTFGLDQRLSPLEVFGRGANHVHATNIFTYTIPQELKGILIPVEQRAALTSIGQASLEMMTLADIPPHHDTRMQLNDHTRLNGSKFVQGQNEVRDSLIKIGRHRLDDLMVGTAISDILDLLLATGQRLGVDLGTLFDGGTTALTPFLKAMPSRWVEKELRRMRQSNPQKAWEANDLWDVSALSVAIPYCNIVLTEKFWTGIVNTGKVNRPSSTVVLRDLRELPQLLEVTVS